MSGRIRSIKPEVLEDEIACSLSDAAWRLWVSLWVLADDYGNVRLGDRFLAANVWQDTRRDPSGPRDELVSKKLLAPYAVRSQRYGHINGWDRHQRVDRPGKERVPAPSADDGTWNQDVSGSFTREQVGTRESPPFHATDLRSPTTTTTTTGPDGSVFEHPTAPDLKPHAAPLLLLQLGPSTASVPECDLFDHWLAGWRLATRGTRAPKLDETRRGKIRGRLKDGYSVDDLKRAIDGMWATPWNVENKHYDIELVCRNSIHVDRFMALAPPQPTESSTRSRWPAEPKTDPLHERDYTPAELAEIDAELESTIRQLQTAHMTPHNYVAIAADHELPGDPRLPKKLTVVGGTGP